MTSRRIAAVAPMRLAEVLRRAAAVGAVDIALGIPGGEPPQPVLHGTVHALYGGANQYSDPAGDPELRTAVAALVGAGRGVHVDPDTELTITCGATEGVFIALLVATDPGDEVLIPEPFFELYPGMVRLAGATPVAVPLHQPGWRLRRRDLEAAVTDRTTAIVLNTPHNPTGRVFDAEELGTVLEVCAEHDLTCVTDEVYEQFTFDGRRHLSPLAHPAAGGRVVSVSSLSKTLEMTGWRIGYCVAPPPLTTAIRRAHEHATLGTGRPLQTGAAAMPDPHSLSHQLSSRRSRFRRQRDLMVDRLTAMGFETHRPEGGWFVLARTTALGRPAGVLVRELIDSAGVLVAPGSPFFDDEAEGDRWIRTTFVRDPRATADALDRMAALVGRCR